MARWIAALTGLVFLALSVAMADLSRFRPLQAAAIQPLLATAGIFFLSVAVTLEYYAVTGVRP